MAHKEIRDTSILSRKEAMTLARKICPTDRGQYSRVSRCALLLSPTKALAAMTEAVMMGMMRKNTGE